MAFHRRRFRHTSRENFDGRFFARATFLMSANLINRRATLANVRFLFVLDACALALAAVQIVIDQNGVVREHNLHEFTIATDYVTT